MPENGRGSRRVSKRLNQNGSSNLDYNQNGTHHKPSTTLQKRSKQTGRNQSNGKRRKIETKEEKLSRIMAEFRILINELFQLQHFKSIVYWDPQEFSSVMNNHLPESFQNFQDENANFKLKWDDEIEDMSEIRNLPMRFQKKKLNDIENALNEKYPFRQDIIEKSNQIEQDIMRDLNVESSFKEDVRFLKASSGKSNRNKKPSSSPKLVSINKNRPESKKSKMKKHLTTIDSDIEEVEDEEDVFSDDEEESKVDDIEDLDEEESAPENFRNPRVKSVKSTIPIPIVTHPSHIPLWRAQPVEKMNLGDKIIDITGENDSNEDNIIQFDPTPLTILRNQDSTIIAPELSRNLDSFLNENCKTPIIDESIMPDFDYSKEEYDKIVNQQEIMLKKIRDKINIDNSLELVEDRIERRKIVLPQTNTKATDPFRLTSTVTPKVQAFVNNLTHQDHLIAQGIAFSKIHQQMRRQHQLRTRKVSSMIEQHFKKKAGEKERLIKEREQNLRKVSRLAMQAVKKRWNQAFKVYQIIQNEKNEELKKIQGREHLSQMLEHSTQLLEAQLTSSREATEDIESDSDDDNSDLEGSDSENFSSSSAEEEIEIETNKKNDDKDIELSVDELRKKYANLESSSEPQSPPVIETEKDAENDLEDSTNKSALSTLYGDVLEIPSSKLSNLSLDYTEEQKSLIDKLNEDSDTAKNSLLNSDESESMSESDSMSESESEDEGALGEEQDKSSEQHSNGKLASLFSNDHDDEDDEFMEDDNEEYESDSTMKSAGEEQESAMDIKTDDRNTELDTEDESNVEVINGAKVKDVPVPSLLRGTLRPYQKQGLNWLASLYNNSTNGILADEMGLGKTIQTISLLAYLACEKHIWGPHLIVVPTSVMLNWDMEFKKFAPGFKVLTYYGSPQQRAQKRKGWNKPDAFHVCITSYQLVVQDQQSFKRRRWRYMILDEAHNIKNFRSTRWRALLNFNTENRLLLTGTPLQNNLMELWSLLYFLMPSSKVNQAMPEGFANLENFQQWFGRPVDKILEQTTLGNNSDLIDENEKTTSKMDDETKNTVARLHQVLRPYLLRRLKKDVEKQMPGKYEHIVYCRLSKRQRFLYDDFMSRAKTKETLASGNFLSIINCLMQLRKVCNHPDLFEIRPVVTSFALPRSASSSYQQVNNSIVSKFNDAIGSKISYNVLNLDIVNCENTNYFVARSRQNLKSSMDLEKQIELLQSLEDGLGKNDLTDYVTYHQHLKFEQQLELKEKLKQRLYINNLRCSREPIYGDTFLKMMKFSEQKSEPLNDVATSKFVMTIPKRVEEMGDIIEKFSIITPSVVALDMKDQLIPIKTQNKIRNEVASNQITNPYHKSQVKLSIAFPDKSLLQFDCGKLQKLAKLLQKLTSEGHRALIFTQMTKVLDILEQFLNIHGYRYMRLDGATKIEDRQLLTEKFNRDPKIPVFILSTRSGGLGINLTGADTVIFYDSDWNPAMDKQCQDRCHRIGQVRDVHIYRFVSEFTIESNIIKKANQKRQLDNVVIQEGEFTTDYFGKFSVKDLVSDANVGGEIADRTIDFSGDAKMSKVFAQAEDEEDRKAAGAALQEVQVDEEDFVDDNTRSTTDLIKKSQSTMFDDDENMDVDFEEGIGHIDEYMIRFISDGYYNN